MNSTIHIAIADDHNDLRRSLTKNLALIKEIKIIIEAIDGIDLLNKLRDTDTKIDLILLDVDMPNMGGVEAVKNVKKLYHDDIKIVMLTVFDDEEKIFEAIKAGACGYITKDEGVDVIHKSIIEALNGGAPMSSIIAQKILGLLRNVDKSNNNELDAEKLGQQFELSKREVEVLTYLRKGFSYKKIADTLFISDGTIKKHVDNIYRKLQVNSRIEAINKVQS